MSVVKVYGIWLSLKRCNEKGKEGLDGQICQLR